MVAVAKSALLVLASAAVYIQEWLLCLCRSNPRFTNSTAFVRDNALLPPYKLSLAEALLCCHVCLQAGYRAEKFSIFPHVDSPAALIKSLAAKSSQATQGSQGSK